MRRFRPLPLVLLTTLFLGSFSGCALSKSKKHLDPIPADAPRECRMLPIPEYRIEPPDILTIEVVNILPRTPYRLRTLDVVTIEVDGTLPDAPIAGSFPVGLNGELFLGAPYGSVQVAGLTADEVEIRIADFLSSDEVRSPLKSPEVFVEFSALAAKQDISGEVLVGPDGRITLGSYGSVLVVGMTLAEAQFSIQAHLSQFLKDPVVSVDIFAYNSRNFYIVLEGAGLGDQVFRFPFTGNETVLDAMSLVNGTTELQSKKIWVARPSCGEGCPEVLPVNWCAITKEGNPCTNYQIYPGDRIFVAEDKRVALDNQLAKMLAPLERVMGFSLLSVETVTRFSGKVLRGGGNPRTF